LSTGCAEFPKPLPPDLVELPPRGGAAATASLDFVVYYHPTVEKVTLLHKVPPGGESPASTTPPARSRKKRRLVAVLLAVVTILSLGGPLSAAAGPFTRRSVDPDFPGAWSLDAADLDGDGDLDLAGTGNLSFHHPTAAGDRIGWWENRDGGFVPRTTEAFQGAWTVHCADLDGDGDTDLVGTGYLSWTVAWWENDGRGGFTRRDVDTAFPGPVHAIAADLDRDGDSDLVGAGYDGGVVAWWENDGTQGFIRRTVDDSFEGAGGVAAADLDGDGDTDLAGVAYEGNLVAWWENDGAQGFVRRTVATGVHGAGWILATDLDRDGDTDLLTTAFHDGAVSWWENDGRGEFVRRTVGNDFTGAKAALPLDADWDGDLDVVGSAYGEDGTGGGLAWWENDGSMGFSRRTLDAGFRGAKFAAVGDLDGDGDTDVAAPSPTLGQVCWWENRQELTNGSFETRGRGIPGWRGRHLSPDDGPAPGAARSGHRSLRLTGTPQVRTVWQTVARAGRRGDILVLSGWSRLTGGGTSVRGVRRLTLTVTHRDGSLRRHLLRFAGAPGRWEFSRGVWEAAADYRLLTVAVRHGRGTGTARFDDLRLAVR
jgi:hypothetical protein